MLGYNLNTTGIPKMFKIKMTHSLSHKIHQYDFLLLAEHLYTGVFLLSLHIHYRRINRHIVFGSISNTLDCYLRFCHPFSIKKQLVAYIYFWFTSIWVCLCHALYLVLISTFAICVHYKLILRFLKSTYHSNPNLFLSQCRTDNENYQIHYLSQKRRGMRKKKSSCQTNLTLQGGLEKQWED